MSWMSKLLKRNKLNIKKIKKLFGFESEKKNNLDPDKNDKLDFKNIVKNHHGTFSSNLT
jgi:hypothetical protein